MLNVYEQIANNKRKSWIIIIGFIIFIGVSSYFISLAGDYSLSFVGIALIFAGLMSFVSYWYSDKIILALSNARPADKRTDFKFFTVTENLSIAAQIPMPKLYVIDDTALNAFATGRDPDHAVVCATSGLINKMDRTELEAVVAHELSHIRYYDMRLMSLVTILIGMLTLLADWFIRMGGFGRRRNRDKDNQIGTIAMLAGIILALLSPIIANLIKLAISRQREYQADAGAVLLTRQPDGMISALTKLSQDKEPLEVANKATAHLYISNPFKNGSTGMFASLFNTHPAIEDRIKALENMK